MKAYKFNKVFYCLLCMVCSLVVVLSCNKPEPYVEDHPLDKQDVWTEISGEVREMNRTTSFGEVYLMPFVDSVVDVRILDDAIAVAIAQHEINTMEKLKQKFPNSNYGIWIKNYKTSIETMEQRHRISGDEIVERAKHWVDTIIYNPNTICFSTDSIGHFYQRVKTGEYLLLALGNMEFYPEELNFISRKRAIFKQINVGADGVNMLLSISTVFINKENGDIKTMDILNQL